MERNPDRTGSLHGRGPASGVMSAVMLGVLLLLVPVVAVAQTSSPAGDSTAKAQATRSAPAPGQTKSAPATSPAVTPTKSAATPSKAASTAPPTTTAAKPSTASKSAAKGKSPFASVTGGTSSTARVQPKAAPPTEAAAASKTTTAGPTAKATPAKAPASAVAKNAPSATPSKTTTPNASPNSATAQAKPGAPGPNAASKTNPAPDKNTVAGQAPGSAESAKSPAANAPAGVKPVAARPSAPPAKSPAAAGGAPATPVQSEAAESEVVRRIRTANPQKPMVPDVSIEKRQTYQYNTIGRRDPFESMVANFVGDDVGGDAPPDVGALKVVGIVWGADTFALVEDAAGNSGILRRGDKVMNGFVEDLKRDAMVVKITADGHSQSVAIPLTRKGDQSNANR
jgi:hypothetical protein